MKTLFFIKTYNELMSEIPEKFEKIQELTKEWEYFNGKEIIKKDYSPFNSLKYFKQSYQIYLDIIDETIIRISWNDDVEDYYCVNVSEMFFDDFNGYLEYVKNLVSENKKSELEKYSKYLDKLQKSQKLFEDKEYQEYLRLKKKFEKWKLI